MAFGNSFNDNERCLLAGYDNGDVKMFDLRMNKVSAVCVTETCVVFSVETSCARGRGAGWLIGSGAQLGAALMTAEQVGGYRKRLVTHGPSIDAPGLSSCPQPDNSCTDHTDCRV